MHLGCYDDAELLHCGGGRRRAVAKLLQRRLLLLEVRVNVRGIHGGPVDTLVLAEAWQCIHNKAHQERVPHQCNQSVDALRLRPECLALLFCRQAQQ